MNCEEAIARLKVVQEKFEARYYRWSLEQAEKELRNGFASLRRIPSSTSFLLLDFLKGSTSDEASSFLYFFEALEVSVVQVIEKRGLRYGLVPVLQFVPGGMARN
jgi:hypothetical protein